MAVAEALPPLQELPGRRVYPGDPLCTIEEFIPGDGVYVDESGVVRAARVGVVELDMVQRRISVRPYAAKPRLPRKNHAVYAIVVGVPRDDLALVKIFADERMVPYNGFFTAVLHISQASDRRIPSIYDAVRPGDIIRATLTTDAAPYVVSTKRPQDGVILAQCSVCGAPLYRVPGKQLLVCKKCGNEEPRKVSPYYVLTEKRRGRS
jgi:exosome complex component CSL4